MPTFPSPTKTWHTTAYPAIDPTQSKLSASNKNIIVTGGGSGIGPSIVAAFAQAHASKIGIVGRTASTLKETKRTIEQAHKDVKIISIVGDITDETSMTKAFETFHAEAGEVAVLVHNAAYMPDLVALKDADPAEWWKGYEVNVKGTLHVTQAFLRHAATNAILIGVGTGAAAMVFPNCSAYLSSKFAESKVFELVQVENPGIRVHNVHPGGIKTQMVDKTEAAGLMAVPLDDPSLPGAFIVWTASPEAAFTKGKFLWCNWDVDELREQEKRMKETNYLTLGLDGWPFQNQA